MIAPGSRKAKRMHLARLVRVHPLNFLLPGDDHEQAEGEWECSNASAQLFTCPNMITGEGRRGAFGQSKARSTLRHPALSWQEESQASPSYPQFLLETERRERDAAIYERKSIQTPHWFLWCHMYCCRFGFLQFSKQAIWILMIHETNHTNSTEKTNRILRISLDFLVSFILHTTSRRQSNHWQSEQNMK